MAKLALKYIWNLGLGMFGVLSIWDDDLREEGIERSMYEDPLEQWRDDMAELERFEMLGF